MLSSSSKGQTAIEYLFLLAGAIYVVTVVLLSIIAFTSVGELFFYQQYDEYSKLDICTAFPASCNFFLDWQEGLEDLPAGFFMENQSSFRTISADGMMVELYCGGDTVCNTNIYSELSEAKFSFELPVQWDGDSWEYCNIGTTLDTTCFGGIDVPLCDVGTGLCRLDVNSSIPLTWTGFGVDLDPLQEEEAYAGVNQSLLLSSSVTGLRVIFHISDLTTGAFHTDPGFDTKANKLSWADTWPNGTGSPFSCRDLNVSGLPAMDYIAHGCTSDFGCNLTPCSNTIGWPTSGYCADHSLSGDTKVCLNEAGNVTGVPECIENTPYSSLVLYDVDNKSDINGYVQVADLSRFKLIGKPVPPHEPSWVFSMQDFVSESACASNDACRDACRNKYLDFLGHLKVYAFPFDTNVLEMCQLLEKKTADIVFVEAITMIGGYSEDTATRHCLASLKMSTFILDYSQTQGHDLVKLGIVLPPGTYSFPIGFTDANVQTPFFPGAILPPHLTSLFFPNQ